MEKIIKFAFPILLIAVLSGCHSLKTIFKESPKTLSWKETVELSPKFHSMEWKNGSAEIEIGSQQFNSPVHGKIIRDSAIHISATPFLGMEMFKIEIGRAEISVFDKVNKKLYQVKYNLIDSISGNSFVFDNLQDIFSNKAFIYAPTPRTVMLKSVQNDTVLWTLERKTANQIVYLNKEGRMSGLSVKGNNAGIEFSIQYSEFKNWKEIQFPQSMDIELKNKKNTIHLNLKFNNLNFDNSTKLKYENQEAFSRVPISTVL